MKNEVVRHFEDYNFRRYSTPWVCRMTERGEFDFNTVVGTYTGDGKTGEAGDLIVYEPQTGMVYGYGRKDYRGSSSFRAFVKWDGENFVSCDKLGREAK